MSKLLTTEELKSFIEEFKKPPYVGVRVNTLKCSVDKLLGLVPYITQENTVPFCNDGFYLNNKDAFSGNHPLHHAGAVYFQEPSAMSAATLLSPQEGERILDLCAAPGGKSTQIAAALNHTGLIWSNEIVKSRAAVLLSNFERCGVRAGVVSNSEPEVLCSSLRGFFDKVLVDAPCSGEGMIRRDPKALAEWSVEHTRSCGLRQLKILESAKQALKPGGTLVYSTCTFSREENEDVVEQFLKSNTDFELEALNCCFGRSALSGKAVRIYPMDGGEGHFAARLRKKEGSSDIHHLKARTTEMKLVPSLVTDFLTSSFYDTSFCRRLFIKGDKVFALPEACPELAGTSAVRAGIFVGTVKKSYFEPAHALYMATDASNAKQAVDLSLDDPRVNAFLHGEEIDVPQQKKGYTAVSVEGITMGYGKVSDGKLKNKYPKGLRTF